jgi:hypothetical protein
MKRLSFSVLMAAIAPLFLSACQSNGTRDADVSFNEDAVRSVIERNQTHIDACYAQALRKNPYLYGKLVVEWEIAVGGKVAQAAVKSDDIKSQYLAECVIKRIKALRFPAPPSDKFARVTFPFEFSKKGT